MYTYIYIYIVLNCVQVSQRYFNVSKHIGYSNSHNAQIFKSTCVTDDG